MNKENLKGKLKKYQTYVLALLLLVSIVGITYAAFVITRESGENTLTTGQISMSYTEPDNAYVVENALPLKDSDGVGINNYFQFEVTSHAKTNVDDATGVTIPYNVTLGKLAIETGKLQLLENQIKVYVTKVESGIETVVLQPTLISSLALDEKNNYIALAASDTHKNGSNEATTTYRLRAWIDYGVEASNFTKDNRYQYKFNVNVNSKVDALGNSNAAPSGTLLVDKIKDRGVVTTGDGLYMSNVTNSGNPTYYYRGQLENNYIKFDGVTTNTCKYNGKQVYELAGMALSIPESRIDCEVETVCSSMGTYIIGLDEATCVNGINGEYLKGTPTWKENDELLWRVVRINEDGTTRIVLESSQIIGQINPSTDDESYMYYTNSNVTGGAMKTLNDWYKNNLNSYDNKIATSDYCEKLEVDLKYGDKYDAIDGFKCPTDKNGKGKFTSKIGMLSLAEVLHSGGIMLEANDYYLSNGGLYWTTTPADFDLFNGAFAYGVYFGGAAYDNGVDYELLLRPVISLNANTSVTGSGTSIDPWIVQP